MKHALELLRKQMPEKTLSKRGLSIKTLLF
jgi:hypothetical protein